MTYFTVLLMCYMAVRSMALLAPTPPTFPSSFSVQFQEIQKLGSVVLSHNNGTWYYDYTNNRARFDHDRGQANNFCDHQNLSPKDPKGDCQLIFTSEGDLIVYYPGVMNCCRVCGKAEGCTTLIPTWLKSGTKLLSVEMINGVSCYGWGKHGVVAAYDTWYSDASGVPCRYHEVVAKIDHNLTFVQGTYEVGPQDPELFNFPRYCMKTCPHPYKPPHH